MTITSNSTSIGMDFDHAANRVITYTEIDDLITAFHVLFVCTTEN